MEPVIYKMHGNFFTLHVQNKFISHVKNKFKMITEHFSNKVQ